MVVANDKKTTNFRISISINDIFTIISKRIPSPKLILEFKKFIRICFLFQKVSNFI